MLRKLYQDQRQDLSAMEVFRIMDKKDKQHKIVIRPMIVLSEPLLVSSWGLPAFEKLETGDREHGQDEEHSTGMELKTDSHQTARVV